MKTLLETYPLILAEAAIAERLRRMEEVTLHPMLFNTPLIYEEEGSAAMRGLYFQYINVARSAKLPLLLAAPTWRLDKNRVKDAGVPSSIIKDAVAFMQAIRAEAMQNADAPPIKVGGLIGPKNDCYQPSEALDAGEAEAFHTDQIQKLASAKVDYITAQTMPSIHEALGMARAMAASGVPYMISFCINRTGHVLDGTPVKDAIEFIDEQVDVAPLGFMVNCAYPTFLCPETQPRSIFSRLVGFQANASSLDHSDLDGSAVSQQDSLDHWGDEMLALNKQYGVSILGGCCGTTDEHLRYIANRQMGR